MSLLDADKHFGGRNIARFEYFLLLENQYVYTVYLCINVYSIRFLCLKNQESMNEKLPTQKPWVYTQQYSENED